jgi:hypothetical protein
MPYIKEERRFKEGEVFSPTGVGDLNYCITMLLIKAVGPEPTYEKFNAAMGVMVCAMFEFYRRKVAPYEDKKIKENGDVY